MKVKVNTDEHKYALSLAYTGTPEDTVEADLDTIDFDWLNCYKVVFDETLAFDVLEFDEIKKEEILADRERVKRDMEAIEEMKLRKNKTEMIADMLTITRERSDKLGYDWEIYTLGSVEIRREYVPSESHAGTLDDPIPFELGLALIPNAYYSYDEHLYVYMGQGGVIAESYPVDEVDGWVLWE